MSSVVTAFELSCPEACGILPGRGSNPRLLPWQADSLPLSHQGSPSSFLSYFKHFSIFAIKTGYQKAWEIVIVFETHFFFKCLMLLPPPSFFFACLLSKWIVGENIEENGYLDSR